MRDGAYLSGYKLREIMRDVGEQWKIGIPVIPTPWAEFGFNIAHLRPA